MKAIVLIIFSKKLFTAILNLRDDVAKCTE